MIYTLQLEGECYEYKARGKRINSMCVCVCIYILIYIYIYISIICYKLGLILITRYICLIQNRFLPREGEK